MTTNGFHATSAPDEVGSMISSLGQTGYLCSEELGTTAYLAVRMGRPLLLEGEPGTGKTAFAEALSMALGRRLIRLQCYEGIDASQALYDWNFPRQILHLRALETVEHLATHAESLEQLERSLYDERFLLDRPVLNALRGEPALLLIDEIDRADDEFEAFLLEVLSTNRITIPELGTIEAPSPPLVVLTSNRTRELHDALKRRCLYHWIDHPSLEHEVAILRSRAPEVSKQLAYEVARIVQEIRHEPALLKPPGVSETLDWARALHYLGAAEVNIATAAASVGALVKHREDADVVRTKLPGLLRE